MSNNEKTLIIPDRIQIELLDKKGEPLHQSNILVGIQTYATHKNDVSIYPFMSDINGLIHISHAQIMERADNFISYGIMDYIRIEYAKPRIKVFFWGVTNIQRYLDYNTRFLLDPQIKSVIFENIFGNVEDFFKKKDTRGISERDEYLLFKSSFNRSTQIQENFTLVEDLWDKPQERVSYKVIVPI